MFKLIFTNAKGESIELYGPPYRLMRVEGLGDVEADVQTQKAPFQDGETLIDTVFDARYIQIEIKIVGEDEADIEAKRRYLAAVFNPRLGEGTLFYESETTTRQINAVADSIPLFPDGSTNRGRTFQKAVINLVCPNPYWQGILEGDQMAYLMGGLKFPLVLPARFAHRGFQRVFTNAGDVPTPVQIEFKGPAQNPTIYNRTTGEFIKVNRDLGENDILYVDTSFGNKTVEILRAESNEKENAFNYIDLDSTFFQLEVGDNLIEYNSNNDSILTRVRISYRNRYVAI